jgi:anti-sigma B factor antagonist
MSAVKRNRKRAAAAAGACVTDDLTIHRAQTLHTQLREWLEQGVDAIDLSGVGECDSAGVQLLLAARASATAAGRTLRVEAPSAGVLEALNRYGLDERLEHRAGVKGD